MTTFIINKDTGQIIAALSGSSEYHKVYIDSCDNVAAVEGTGDSSNKIGKEIDGTWQIVDDIPRMIERAAASKILEVNARKTTALDEGMVIAGETHSNGSWVPGDIIVKFSGYDYAAFRKISDRIVVNSKLKPGEEDSKLLRGRQSFKLLLNGKKRLIFINIAAACSFVEQYEDRLAIADIIEQEKISEIYDLQEIEDIENYDATTGWGEINA